MSKFYLVAVVLLFMLAAYVVVFQGGAVRFGDVEIKSNQNTSIEKSSLPDSQVRTQEQNATVNGSGNAVNASGGASVSIKP